MNQHTATLNCDIEQCKHKCHYNVSISVMDVFRLQPSVPNFKVLWFHNAKYRTFYFTGVIFLTASKTSAVSTLSPNSFSRCSRRIPCKTQTYTHTCLEKHCWGKSNFSHSVWVHAYLLSWSDDKHPSQDEALAIHVALVTGPPSPYEVLPNSKANET